MNEYLDKLASMTKRVSFTARLKGMPEVVSRPARRIKMIGTFLDEEDSITSILLEVADTEEKRRRGMMGRKSLPEICGMLFTGLGGGGHFWMKDCLIPLDVAFMDDRGYIRKTYSMKVDKSGKTRYEYGPDVVSAVELPHGFLDKWGIRTGYSFFARRLLGRDGGNG